MRWHERIQKAWTNPALNWELANQLEGESKRNVVSFIRDIGKWHVFWTQTYRGRHSEVAAQERWLRFLAESSLLSDLTAHIWAVEPHENIPSHHVHALLSMKSTRVFKSFMASWRVWKENAWTRLGKALILPADDKAPIHYVLKYVLKSQNRKVSTTSSTPENLWGVWTADPRKSRIQA